MVFTDPPYNVPIAGHAGGLGRVRHRDFAMAAGEMDRAEFTRFLQRAIGLLCQHSVRGSLHYLCMDWRHAFELLGAALPHYAAFRNLCVWNKDNAGMGSFYRSKHELVFVFQNGAGPGGQQRRAGRHRPLPHQRLGLPGANTLRPGRGAEHWRCTRR